MKLVKIIVQHVQELELANQVVFVHMEQSMSTENVKLVLTIVKLVMMEMLVLVYYVKLEEKMHLIVLVQSVNLKIAKPNNVKTVEANVILV